MPIEILEMYLDNLYQNHCIIEIDMIVLLGVIHIKIITMFGTKRFIGISIDKMVSKIEKSL